jgi:hypothetical protein
VTPCAPVWKAKRQVVATDHELHILKAIAYSNPPSGCGPSALLGPSAKALEEMESFSQGRIAPYGWVWAQQYASRQSGNCEALTFPFLGERLITPPSRMVSLSYLHDVANRTNSPQRMRLSSITLSMNFRSALLSAPWRHRDPAVTAGPRR